MAHYYPDFSDDSDFTDDPEYDNFKAFKQKLENEKNKTQNSAQRVLTEEDQRKTLFNALSSGNIHAVIKTIEHGLNINSDVQGGWTPLLLAASFGNPELTSELLKRGADVNLRRDGCTPLMMACNCPKNTSPYKKSLEVIKQLVETGANVKAINRKRMTALMFASNNGNLEAVKYLLPLSDKDAEDNQKWTALFWAVNNNSIEIVNYLLQEGFTYSSLDIRNNSPLDIAKNNDFHAIIDLFPKEEPDVISSIIDSCSYTFEQIFEKLKPGERPKFFLDICNILCGVRSEAMIKPIADKDIGLFKFLSISDKELEGLGVKLPFQRKRILSGIHRFHKQPYHPKSLHVVPLNETYSNIDMAIQLLSAIKQITAMDACLTYIMKNYNGEDLSKADMEFISKNVETMKNTIRRCQMVTKNLKQKTILLDSQVKPVDQITKNSRRHRVPWRKLIFSCTVLSLIFVYRIIK
ncbi:hypothetical protein NQ317_014060 [Molorchus minor]|uniref:Uncharacterized protein n=1 Tax=Molorchus minor TaxID=1323400 RepID=A0ABQ9J1I4_9CUCU|nr:hypothetical protein NQ317_014060 [Molorchus minor]